VGSVSGKVLVVDDSKLMHKMYEVMLRPYTLIHAYDGSEALERLTENPDVEFVLLDINMPVMDGLEFLERVHRDGKPPPPVIVVSTEGRKEDTARGLEAGAVAYITKPFSSTELREVIDRLPSER
jgi:two-component system chemotaxis response regulator CheY